MDPSQPIDLSRDGQPSDSSGTPIALLEQVRERGDLVVAASLESGEVLVEYPLSPRWRERLGIERFVRLRGAREGKGYAVLLPAPPTQRPRRRSRRRKKEEPPPEPQLVPKYVEDDPVGRRLNLEGAGIMAYQSGDQMHPPMVDSEELWADSGRWPEAAQEHTRQAARALGLRAGERVLDIGCGIGGPARQLVDEFGVVVHGVGNAPNMLETARRINAERPAWDDAITVELHDCQDPYAVDGFDAAWSMNMIYRVLDKGALLRNAAAAMREGGRIMVEDWMLTSESTAADREAMERHHFAGSIAAVEELRELLAETGFEITAFEDLGQVGATHMARHFTPQFNAEVRPRLEADFPGSPVNGAEMADQWVEGIELTIGMYVSGAMTYGRFVAVLSS